MTGSTIHQLYCTHCTYGTSYQHQRTTGAVKDQAFEYSTRAGSMPRETSHDFFRQVEPYMYYHLPGDLPGDQILKHDASTTTEWRRFVFMPSVSGMQVLAHVAYRTTDTQGRPGSYFAHVLMSERSQGDSLWSAAEAAKLWGSSNWVAAETSQTPFELNSLTSLQEFRAGELRSVRTIDDQVLLSFLTAPMNSPFDDPGRVIPDRWKQKSPAERRDVLIDCLQGFMELNFDRRQTMLLAVEPCLAALIFYGVARLLPTKGIGEKLSFSTFESHLQRPQTALAATTFVNAETGELPRDPQQSRGFAINTFRPDTSPVLPWKSRPVAEQPQYARTLVNLFVGTDGPHLVDDLIKGFEQAGAVQKDELEELVQADDLAEAFLTGNSEAAVRRLKSLKEPVKKYLGESVSKRLSRLLIRTGPTSVTTPSAPPPVLRVLGAPPPPPGSANASLGSLTAAPIAAEVVFAAVDEQPPAAPVPTPLATPSVPAVAGQGSPEFRQIADNPARVLHLFKLIAAEEDSPASSQVIPALLETFISTGQESFPAFLRDADITSKYRREALLACVERDGKLPAGCEWLWSETKASNGQPALITDLLTRLSASRATLVLTDLLETDPDKDRVRGALEVLGQVCQSDESKRPVLVEFVDHPQLKPALLLDALRSAQSVRKPVFDHYAAIWKEDPSGDFRLHKVLDELFGKLTDAREYQRSLDLVTDAKELLFEANKTQLRGWLDLRKHLQALKALQENPPNFVVNLLSSTHRQQLEEVGQHLAKSGRMAMPDDEYGDDEGRERGTHLRAIARLVMAPHDLPDSFRGKLESALAGYGWKDGGRKPRDGRSRSYSDRDDRDADSASSWKKRALWIVSALLVTGIAAWAWMSRGGSESTSGNAVAQITQPASIDSHPASSKTVERHRPERVKPSGESSSSQEGLTGKTDSKQHSQEQKRADTPAPSGKPQSPDMPPKEPSPESPKSQKPPEPTAVASVTPKSPTEPPKPIPPKAEPPSSSKVTFNKGPEQKLIAYVELPEYSAADKAKQELRVELPEGNPVTAIQLLGFREHRERLADSDFNVLKGPGDDALRVLDVMHACLSDAGATTQPLCTFEISENKLLRARWQHHKTIGDVKPLVDAVRCCVLEIQRGENKDEWLYVCFLKPVTMAQPLEFVDGKYQLPSDQLPLVMLSNPLSFGKTQLRVFAPEPINKTFDFSSPERPRFPTASMEQMRAKFGFSNATLTAEKEKGQAAYSLEMNVNKRPRSSLESNEISRISTYINNLKSLRSSAQKGGASHASLASELKVNRGEKEDDRAFSNRVQKEFEKRIAELEDKKRVHQERNEVERKSFLEAKPLLSGTLYRVVGGKLDGNELLGGVVVEAIHIPEPKKNMDKPKDAASNPAGI